MKLSGPLRIRAANACDAPQLTDLALRSKAMWGYTAEFMAQCRSELTLTAEFVAANPVFLIGRDGMVLGFYSLVLSGNCAELAHLFVEPGETRKGAGKQLWDHAAGRARDLGCTVLTLQADPQAEQFYVRCGAVRTGLAESAALPGRMLPRMEIRLSE